MRNNLEIRLCSTIFIAILSLSSFYQFTVNAQTDYYHQNFEWRYDQYEWTWSLDIPKSLYESYKSVPLSTRVSNGPAGYGFLTTTNDHYVKMVAEKLHEAATQKGYDHYEEVSLVLAFVQSLPYATDSVTSGYDEYPRFPLETLVENGGDCEDTAILFATLMIILNYEAVYINPPEHYAVGIWGNNIDGSYYTYNDKTYYYCETVGEGFTIGEIPSEYKDSEAFIYNIRVEDQYVPGASESPPSLVGNSNEYLGWVVAVLATAGLIILGIVISNKREASTQPAVPEFTQ